MKYLPLRTGSDYIPTLDLTDTLLQTFAQLLQAPRDDADAIIKERFPVPRLVICDQYGSQVISSCSSIYKKLILVHITAYS